LHIFGHIRNMLDLDFVFFPLGLVFGRFHVFVEFDRLVFCFVRCFVFSVIAAHREFAEFVDYVEFVSDFGFDTVVFIRYALFYQIKQVYDRYSEDQSGGDVKRDVLLVPEYLLQEHCEEGGHGQRILHDVAVVQ